MCSMREHTASSGVPTSNRLYQIQRTPTLSSLERVRKWSTAWRPETVVLFRLRRCQFLITDSRCSLSTGIDSLESMLSSLQKTSTTSSALSVGLWENLRDGRWEPRRTDLEPRS